MVILRSALFAFVANICFDFVVREKMCIFVGDENGVFDRIYGVREDDARGAAGAVAWVAVCRP